MNVYVFDLGCSYLGGTAVVAALTERRARTIAARACKDAGYTPQKDRQGNELPLVDACVATHTCDNQGLVYFWDGDY